MLIKPHNITILGHMNFIYYSIFIIFILESTQRFCSSKHQDLHRHNKAVCHLGLQLSVTLVKEYLIINSIDKSRNQIKKKLKRENLKNRRLNCLLFRRISPGWKTFCLFLCPESSPRHSRFFSLFFIYHSAACFEYLELCVSPWGNSVTCVVYKFATKFASRIFLYLSFLRNCCLINHFLY